MRDDIFQDTKAQIVDFAFNDDVAKVFPDMIRRSIPGYENIIPLSGLMAARHVGARGRIFDLGCSLGASTLAVLQQNESRDIEVIGVDSSSAMIKQARANIDDPRVRFVCDDLRNVDMSGADVVVCNFVLQFVAREERLGVLQKIHSQLRDDGLLLVSEKVRHDDASLHTLYDETHLAWKRANGYTDLEISQKRTALENVMHIDTEAEHHARFAQAGFSQSRQWYRCLNWASFTVTA